MGNSDTFVNGKLGVNYTNNFKHTSHTPSIYVMSRSTHLHSQHLSPVIRHLPHHIQVKFSIKRKTTENEPIGIILSAGKDEILVEYAMGGISNKIFISKYQLYLPDKKTLQEQLKSVIANP
jgi:hypothetical protein